MNRFGRLAQDPEQFLGVSFDVAVFACSLRSHLGSIFDVFSLILSTHPRILDCESVPELLEELLHCSHKPYGTCNIMAELEMLFAAELHWKIRLVQALVLELGRLCGSFVGLTHKHDIAKALQPYPPDRN
jgi:hypothetical protein